MLFAIDYDNTWSADPALFKKITNDLKKAGHRCVCITARSKDTDQNLLENSIGKHMKIYYANGEAKKKYAEKKGLSVHIWIDDNPGNITSDFTINHHQSEIIDRIATHLISILNSRTK